MYEENSSVKVLPTFASEFGIEGTAQHVADLQGNVVSIFQGGAFFGALGSSPIMDKLGRKWVSPHTIHTRA